MSVDEIWQEWLDKDDRTSPAEYPEMVLVTRAELEAAVVAEREDCALLAFAVVIRTLTGLARGEVGKSRDRLLDLALAVGSKGRECARAVATGASADIGHA